MGKNCPTVNLAGVDGGNLAGMDAGNLADVDSGNLACTL